MKIQDIEIQRQYYSNTADRYDEMHLAKDQEHVLALHLLSAYIEFYKVRSVLDVGAGTGRTLTWLKQRHPGLVVKGIEPVQALREQAYQKGISSNDLFNGDATQLAFHDNSFDLVCEFAVLHHIREPNKAVQEMSRVASKMICISDCNYMGQGKHLIRLLKHVLFTFGLWGVANTVKTRGKGYTISEEDGLAYSYSVYQSLSTIRQFWKTVRITSTGGVSDLRYGQILSASQLLLIALQKRGRHDVD